METPETTLPPLPTGFAAILFGLECMSTAIVLRDLLAAGVPVRLICVPGRASIPLLRGSRRRSLPLAPPQLEQQSVAHIASVAGIEIWRIGNLKAREVHAALNAVEADLVIVACYDRLLPSPVYENREYGGINLHPSLLPDKRGPDPLFWMFRHDDGLVGATVHRLTPRYDAGAVLAQERIDKPDGITESELDASLSRIGARLLAQTISGLATGTVEEVDQTESEATWAPHPADADFHLDRCQSARSAFNFVRGIEGRSRPISVDVNGRRREISRTHRWSRSIDPTESLPAGATAIEFADGWLIASLLSPENSAR